MNSLLDDDDDDVSLPAEREITLGTGTILGIFLGLVLLCGLFFGFGYKVGSHKAAPPVEAATTENTPAASANFSGFKPAAGSPVGSLERPAPKPAPAPPASTATDEPDGTPAPHAAPAIHIVRTPPTAAAQPATSTAITAAPTGTIFVQVAAVSHEEDASLLVNALRAKGYPVNARTVAQDKFFHIQVGPFTSRADAESAKQRLLADGYQPILK
jgi:DedD protein